MKKILLATTMLAGFAGVAAAEVTLSGESAYWITSDDGHTDQNFKTNVTFDMSGETDSGLSFGATLTLMNDGDTDGPGSLWIEGAFGKLSFNDVDSADAAVGIGMADIGFDGIGIDDDAEADRRNASGSTILYTYTTGGLTFAASIDSADSHNDGDFAVGAKYVVDAGYRVSAAYSQADGYDIMAVGAGGTFGAVSVNVFYADNEWYGSGFGADVAYTSGALTVSAAYGSADNGGDDDFGIGAAYDLGGGLSVAAGLGSVDGYTQADAGIKLKF